MTDTEHSTELSEHGAQNFPSTLRITVQSVDQVFDDALADLAEEGPADEAVRSFERVADIRQLLTDRRLEVMRTLMTERPESITDLAERLDRNYADVHADVETLANHHIVYFDSDGRAKRPVIPYDRVVLDVEVASGRSDERARA